MKAVYIPEPGKIEVIEREIPQIQKDSQVLVKITAAGMPTRRIRGSSAMRAAALWRRSEVA